MMLSRRQLRILMMKAIFQLPFHEAVEDAMAFPFPGSEDLGPEEVRLVEENLAKFTQALDDVDLIIKETLIGWDFHRLAKVDLAILRLATYEMYFVEDIPSIVSIDEAIELAKKFSTDDSSRFINGILGSIYKKFEEEKRN